MIQGKFAASAAILVVVVAVGVGLFISGSPERQREIRADEQRVIDLGRVSAALSRYYRDTRRLPDDLAPLVDGRTLTTMPRDPVSDEPYDYTRVAPAAYRLCAEFHHEATRETAGDFWAHAAGRQCFDFDYTAVRLD